MYMVVESHISTNIVLVATTTNVIVRKIVSSKGTSWYWGNAIRSLNSKSVA